MHEVGIMESALQTAVKHARQQGASRILRVSLRVGVLSGVEPDALSFAFECVTRGTMADGSALDVEQVPVVCFCRRCEAEFEPEGLLFNCPVCSEWSGDVRHGRELELAQLEVS